MAIGIIGAMDVEVSLLREAMGSVDVKHLVGMEFAEGLLGDTSVVVVKSGVGKVDAAVCAQVLADRFGVTAIINTGVAGALDPRLEVGDIVVSIDALYHDVDATNFGYAPGEVPGLGTRSFAADADLREKAVRAARLAAPGVSVWEGRIASGDQFVRTVEDKERIRSGFDAACCEMEGTAIAQTAWLNGIPFVVVRAISDKVGSTTTVEYSAFEEQAARHCAAVILRMVGESGR